MAKKRELIINLGSAHISASVFTIAENITLQGFYYQEFNPENLTENEWLPELEKTLGELAKKNRLSGVAKFVLPGSLVLSKTIRVPKVDLSKKRKIVEYELSQKLPFPIKDLTWDFTVIDDDGIEEEILSFAIKPDLAHKLSKIIFSCGFTPTHFIPAAILDHEAIKATPNTENQECLFLNMGAKSTNIIFKNPTGFLVRTINLGGNSLTEIISEQLATSFKKSEKLKLEYLSGDEALNQEDANELKLLNSRQVFLNKFAQELSRAIVTYKRLKKGRTPQAIYVTGRGIRTQGLLNTLSSSQRLPVQYFNPYDLISLEVDNFEQEILAELPYLTSEAAGLAYKLLEKDGEETIVNLLPKKKIREIESKKKLPWLALSCLFLSILPLPWLLKTNEDLSNINSQILKQSSEINKIKKSLALNQKNNAELLDLQKINNYSSNYLENICQTTSNTSSIQDFLNGLQFIIEEDVNENTWIDSVNFYQIKIQPGTNYLNTQLNSQGAKITGRYIVKTENTAYNLSDDQKKLALIDSNGRKQESLTNSFSGHKQVIKVLNKVFSTEGKGDLYNRQFTHFEFDLELDLLK